MAASAKLPPLALALQIGCDVPPPPLPSLHERVRTSRNGAKLPQGLDVGSWMRQQTCEPMEADCPCGNMAGADGLELEDSQRDGLILSPRDALTLGDASESGVESSSPAKTGMRAYAEHAIQRVRDKREYESAKLKHTVAVRNLHYYQARKLSMAGCKDKAVQKYALLRIAPLQPLPELPTPRGAMAISDALSTMLDAAEGGTSAEYNADVQKIDFHQHCMHGDLEGLEALMAANAAWGVYRAVLLSLRFPRDTRREVRRRNDWILAMGQTYDALIPFVTVIEDDPGAADMFKEYLVRGAKGLKLIGWHSNYIKQFDYDLRLPSLLAVFRLAEAWGVPVLVHLWLGYSKTKRNYVEDLDYILTEMPKLRFVLAHFGLGFDPETMPQICMLAEKHKNLYFDTSLYGSFCEVWFSRASNQAKPLRDLVFRFPRQVLFGSDIFGSRIKQPKEYLDGLRASVGFVTQEALACTEFRKTDYFKLQVKDKYGSVAFDPKHLHGLQLGGEVALLERIFLQNAKEILNLS